MTTDTNTYNDRTVTVQIQHTASSDDGWRLKDSWCRHHINKTQRSQYIRRASARRLAGVNQSITGPGRATQQRLLQMSRPAQVSIKHKATGISRRRSHGRITRRRTWATPIRCSDQYMQLERLNFNVYERIGPRWYSVKLNGTWSWLTFGRQSTADWLQSLAGHWTDSKPRHRRVLVATTWPTVRFGGGTM